MKVWSKGPACVVSTDNKYIEAATEALHDTFKKDTVFIRSGGSIPIVTDFQDVLKIPQRHDGLRPAGRQPACAQREVPHPELPSRDRDDLQVFRETGKVVQQEFDFTRAAALRLPRTCGYRS